MVRPYTGVLSITELNSIIVQEIGLNSLQQSTSGSMPQPPNTRLQRSSYRGPFLQPYSTVPPLQPYSTVPPVNRNALPPLPYSTVPPVNRNALPLLPYSTVPPHQLLNTGSQPNRNPMMGAPSMPYGSVPFNQLPQQEKKRIMQHLKYENRNRNTMMRYPPPNMKNP